MNRIAWIGMAAALVAFACELPLETERMTPPGDVLEARQAGPPGARGAAHVLGGKKVGEFHVAFAAVDGEGGVQGHVSYREIVEDKEGSTTLRRSGQVVCLQMDRRVKAPRGAAWITFVEDAADAKGAWQFYVQDDGNGPDAIDRLSTLRRVKVAGDKGGRTSCIRRTKIFSSHPIDRGSIQVTGARGVIKK